MTRRVLLGAAAAGVAVVLGGCGSSTPSPSASSGAGAPAIRGTVTVFAASSLTGVFTTLGHEFEQAHPGTTVRFSFGGSDSLAAQIVSGAPADVFASAAPQTMGTVKSAGLVTGNPTLFARNELEIAVAPGNPLNLHTLSDLNKPPVKLALCSPTVPCGSAAVAAFTLVGITPHPVTLELDVKSVLTKIELGEADAGMVYRTDVQAAKGKVSGVDFPQALQVITRDPIAALKNSTNLPAAQAFVAFVLSSEGHRVLAAAGFLSPS